MVSLLAWTIVAAMVAFLIWARFVEPERLRVTTVDVPLADLAPVLDGFRIVQLSDVHGKIRIGGRSLTEIVADQTPDIIVVTGDLINSRGPDDQAIGALANLKAKEGVFFVPGNNERRGIRPGLTEGLLPRLEKAGVVPLINRAVRVERGSGWFWLVGVDDPTRRRLDDLSVAVREVVDDRPRILLAHGPHILKRLHGHRVDYLITGHTHGGQVCLPWYGPLVTRSPFGRRLASGPGLVDGVRVYVSRGIGTSLLPLRLFCPPEIVIHVLKSGLARW